MSLALAFSDTTSWFGLLASTDEVYIYRARVKGAAIKSPHEAMLFARAVGQGQNMKLDVRGVAVQKASESSGGDWWVDVIMTSPESGVAIMVTNASGITQAVLGDSELRATFPSLSVASAELLELTGPQSAIDHWRAQPILWDHALPGAAGRGGPTDTFATPAAYSVVLGKADDGKAAKPWIVPSPGLGPNGSGGGALESATVFWILGIAAVAAVAISAMGKGRRRR